MNYRKASLSDVEELVKIRLGYLGEDFKDMTTHQIDNMKKELPKYYTEHLGRDFIAYIAEENGEVVSSVFLVMIDKPANPNFPTGRIGNVLNVYTKPEYRRQGLSSCLLKTMIEEAKMNHLSYLELMATEQGYPLYKRFGFEETHSHCVPMKLNLM